MKLLYLDCGMGAAGDMLAAALLDLFPDAEPLISALNSFGIPSVTFEKVSSVKCGIHGTGLTVKIHGMAESEHSDSKHDHSHDHGLPAEGSHDHAHHTLHGIEHIVSELALSEKVKQDVLSVYRLLAQAESAVHQVPVSEIHFHEVGNLDAIADITAVCFLMDKLSPQKIIVSPIHVGSGQIRCAHGILPVPAPATALLLKDCPIYSGGIRGELCTPTGAALLKYFADSFETMPMIKVSGIGYGMGKKDFEAANCVRAFLGETADDRDLVYELSCNVDDMTGEAIGYALECFLRAGALDAFTLPINMKKSRPGTMIRIICKSEQKETLTRLMFLHTSTAGIRETSAQRSILQRRSTQEDTMYGTIRKKEYCGYGVNRAKYEYEDLARIAASENISISEVLKNIRG